MVIVKLKGGLGNQMFQYAAAAGIKKRNESIFLDLSFLKKYNQTTDNFIARNFELDIFSNIGSLILTPFKSKLFDGSSKISRRLKSLNILNHEILFQADNDHNLIDLSSKSSIRYLDGYFQSQQYFNNVKESIIEKFSFPELDQHNEGIKKQILASNNSTSIHIRRGDYVANSQIFKYHGVLSLDYYKNALNHLKNELCVEPELFVFSDDFEWVIENLDLSTTNLHLIEGNTEENSWKDMALMTFCKHHIIANSSFSWWGAWLSQRQGQTYAPHHWFAPHVEYNINHLIPDDWIIIK